MNPSYSRGFTPSAPNSQQAGFPSTCGILRRSGVLTDPKGSAPGPNHRKIPQALGLEHWTQILVNMTGSHGRLVGRHLKYIIDSEHLQDSRGIEVYVLPDTSAGSLPVVYMLDGAALDDYVGSIDWKLCQGEG